MPRKNAQKYADDHLHKLLMELASISNQNRLLFIISDTSLREVPSSDPQPNVVAHKHFLPVRNSSSSNNCHSNHHHSITQQRQRQQQQQSQITNI